MMGPLLGLVFLLLIQGQACFKCAVSEKQRPLVKSLLNKMILSATAPEALPNPSVLLALRLARDHSRSTEQKLLNDLTQDAVDKVKNGKKFTSGQVALNALAHQAACSDPRRVSAEDFVLDLVKLLEEKFEMELKHIKDRGIPRTSYYQLGLSVLTLCQLQGSLSPSQVAALFRPDKKKYDLGGHFSVDVASVVVLAQICMQTTDNTTMSEANRDITANIRWLLSKILEQKSKEGVIGNMYSTGLAMQALSVSDHYLTPLSWNCSQTLATVLADIPKGTFDNPMAAAQLIPSLEGRTYLDVSMINCSKSEDNLTLITPPTTLSPTSHQSTHLINVTYTVSVNNTSTSIRVSVPEGSVFLKVMEAAQKENPEKFRFTWVPTAWGPYITSVQGLAADNNMRTYWQLLSGKTPLSKGAGEYVVSNGETLVVKYTTY